jgi:hypothetical protein
MADFYSFEDVLRELKLDEEELRRMVSEGEVRAFRSESKIKFKKEDIERLTKGRTGNSEPIVILPKLAEEKSLIDTGIIGEGLPQTSVEDEAVVKISEGLEVEEKTEPLEVMEETKKEIKVEEAPSEEVRPRVSRFTKRRIVAPPEVEAELERMKVHPIWVGILLLTVVVCSLSGVIFYDFVRLQSSFGEKPSAITSAISKWALDKFWGDGEWVARLNAKLKGGPTTYKGPTFTEGMAEPIDPDLLL